MALRKTLTAADTRKGRSEHRVHLLRVGAPDYVPTTTSAVFFRRATTSNAAATTAGAAESSGNNADVTLLLDAFGQILSAYVQGGVDLPGRSATELSADLEPWRLHAVMGTPVLDGDHCGVADRDFPGVARVFSQLRRTEKTLTESALTELRECLWTCVQRVHVAVQADVEADSASAKQLQRVHNAIQVLETGTVKDEVLEAIRSIEQISRTRHEKQQASFALMVERIDQLAAQLEEARRESETDSLTGLGNRKRFEVAVERARQRHAIGGVACSMVLMDLDGLKIINDTLGHPAGDAVLAHFSNCITKVFLHSTDELCRIGGDEFIALLPGTGRDVASQLAARLVRLVEDQHANASVGDAVYGVSIGFTELRIGEDAIEWLSRTDVALYEAKANGRGCAVGG